MKTLRNLFLPLFLSSITALPAFATVVMALTIEELTQRTPVIVHGTVRRTAGIGCGRGRRGTDARRRITDHRIDEFQQAIAQPGRGRA